MPSSQVRSMGTKEREVKEQEERCEHCSPGFKPQGLKKGSLTYKRMGISVFLLYRDDISMGWEDLISKVILS